MKEFNELRKRLAKEMQVESGSAGEVHSSDSTRMRAMAKAVAYNRVMQMMDEIEAEAARAEVESIPSIREMWVSEQALVIDCPDCGGGDSTCLYCDGTGTVIE